MLAESGPPAGAWIRKLGAAWVQVPCEGSWSERLLLDSRSQPLAPATVLTPWPPLLSACYFTGTASGCPFGAIITTRLLYGSVLLALREIGRASCRERV